MDGIEAALGGADSAAYATVLVDHGSAAAQAAGGFLAHLLFGERAMILLELALRLIVFRCLAGAVVVGFHQYILLVKLDKVPAVASDGHVAMLHEAVQALCRLLSSRDCVNGELGPREHISSDEDIGFCCLIGQFVGHWIDSTEEFHLSIFQQFLQDYGLADGENHHIGLKGDQFVLVVFGSELMLSVEYGGAFLEGNAADLPFSMNFLRAPAWIQHNAIFTCFGTLLKACRHDIFGFEGKHRHLGRAAAHRDAGCIYGHVSAAYNNHFALYFHLAAVGIVEEINGRSCARESLSGNARQASALAADGDIEAFIAFLAKAFDCHILPYFDAALYIHADLAHDIDFGLDYILIQFI